METSPLGGCSGTQPPAEHIFEVYGVTPIGMFGFIWHLRCCKCQRKIDAMTAVEFLMSGAFDKTANPPNTALTGASPV